MITASDVFDAIRSQLDDDNSGRYNQASEADDLPSAVNSAVRYLVTVFNAGFEQKKIFPETLRELTRVSILPVSGSGNVKKANVSSITQDLWTIFGVEPDPLIASTDTTGAPDVLEESRNKFASRLTLEEWSERKEDPFSAGNTQLIPTEFIRPAYLGPGRYFNATDDYIMIRPASVFTDDFVAIWYLVNPTRVTSGTSEIELPESLFNLIVDKALNYLSRQHGPASRYLTVTDKDILQVLSLIAS